MISIEITGDIVAADITITVDNLHVDFTINDHIITVHELNELGLHKLKIINHSDQKWSINQVCVDGNSLRKLLYMSWSITASGHRVQPCTELWEQDQTWILPYANPLSHWINITETKIENSHYGKDLAEQFCIWYPETIKLPDRFPQVVRDFFNYNFDFTVIDKSKLDIRRIPYVPYRGQLDADLLKLATTEILNCSNIVLENGDHYGQRTDNFKEFNLENNEAWKYCWLKNRKRNDRLLEERYPATWKLIDSLGMDFWQAFIGVMPPGGFIYPHTDNPADKDLAHSPYVGCTQLYIPIQWPEHNYIKFAQAGIVSMKSGPMLVNVDHFTHAVVNNSNQYRYVLAIGLNKNDIAQYSGCK
jgi:hypothetical protein